MNPTKIQAVLLVDAFNAGQFFLQQLKKRGYQCLHVQSTSEPISQFFFLRNPEDYLATFAYEGDLNALIKKMTTHYSIIGVIPGTEPGVGLAHQIAQTLNLKRNDDHLQSARRNKYDMVEALKKYGINSVTHYKSGDFNRIKQWVLQHNQWPIVVKPLDSAGSDLVSICYTLEQVEHAFNTIKNARTIFNQSCEEVLLQSFLRGEEYVVNLVSCQGQHFVAEMRMYHKQNLNGKHLYDYEELLDFEGIIQQQLIHYAKQVATAVGIQYGPSHIEIMMTAEGPILVEIGARISGSTHMEISNESLGYNVVDLTIDSYFEEEKFMRVLSDKITLKNSVNTIDVATDKQGYVKNLPSLQFISQLPSVKSVKFNIKLGDYIEPTVSLINSPAKIHLLHHDPKQIEKDRFMIKTLFQTELRCETEKTNIDAMPA